MSAAHALTVLEAYRDLRRNVRRVVLSGGTESVTTLYASEQEVFGSARRCDRAPVLSPAEAPREPAFSTPRDERIEALRLAAAHYRDQRDLWLSRDEPEVAARFAGLADERARTLAAVLRSEVQS